MILEGAFWAVGGAALAKANMITGNSSLAVGQTVICFGGIFFFASGWGDGLPAKIISLRYILPSGPAEHGTLADVSPFYGIACFMFATASGLRGVWGLPKNELISPFWGVACFFIGAWTIGVFALWGPLLVDGIKRYEDLNAQETYSLPPYAWSWIHYFQVIGALFLTAGAVIFGIMDKIWCLGSQAREEPFLASECGGA